MIRRPPRSTRVRSSAASDVYKRQVQEGLPAADNAEPEATESESTPDDTELTKPDIEPVVAEPATELVAPPAGSARIETGSYRCRYAGAMMLFPYMDIVGAQAIFATSVS